MQYSLGGAANVAANMIAAGAEVDIMSAVGSDTNGNILLNELDSAGIHTDYISKLPECVTTTKLRYIAQNHQQLLRVDTEDDLRMRWEIMWDKMKLLEERIGQYDLFLLSDYEKGFLTSEISQYLIQIANRRNIPVLVDVKDRQYGKYKGAFLLKPNRNELESLTGMPVESMEEVIRASCHLCRETESKFVLTTLSMDGLVLVNDHELVMQVQSVAREVFDVTGAGDTFIAYLGIGLAGGDDIQDAVRMANFAAGIQVSKIGTSIVYPNEILAAMGKRTKNHWRTVDGSRIKDVLARLKMAQADGKNCFYEWMLRSSSCRTCGVFKESGLVRRYPGCGDQ